MPVPSLLTGFCLDTIRFTGRYEKAIGSRYSMQRNSSSLRWGMDDFDLAALGAAGEWAEPGSDFCRGAARLFHPDGSRGRMCIRVKEHTHGANEYCDRRSIDEGSAEGNRADDKAGGC